MMTDTPATVDPTRGAGIWSPRYRSFTIGLFVAILMAAFETYAVMAVAPRIASDLQALDRYTWIFNAALLPQIVGTVVFSRFVGRKGPSQALIAGAALLGVGLIAASFAVSINQLVLARIVQGLGMGALINVVYTSVGLVLPDRLRPRAFALLSAAYILPAVGGPFLTGVLAEVFSWRAVFYSVLPFIVATVLLVLPSLRGQGGEQLDESSGTTVSVATVLALGVGAVSYGLTQVMTLHGPVLALLGLLLVWFGAVRALPEGVMSAAPVRPGALAVRGLTTGAFLGVEAMVVYAMTVQHELHITLVGLAVSLSALTWALSSWWQSRLDHLDSGAGRGRRMFYGVAVLAVAEAAALCLPWIPTPQVALVVAVVGSLGAGAGMGFSEPLSGTLALADTPAGESSTTASGMQLVDLVTPAVSVAAAGALINALQPVDLRLGITAAIAAQLCLVVLAVLGAFRLRGAGLPEHRDAHVQ